jgi:hypothetical protein
MSDCPNQKIRVAEWSAIHPFRRNFAILMARTFFMIRRSVALSAALNVVFPLTRFFAITSETQLRLK